MENYQNEICFYTTDRNKNKLFGIPMFPDSAIDDHKITDPDKVINCNGSMFVVFGDLGDDDDRLVLKKPAGFTIKGENNDKNITIKHFSNEMRKIVDVIKNNRTIFGVSDTFDFGKLFLTHILLGMTGNWSVIMCDSIDFDTYKNDYDGYICKVEAAKTNIQEYKKRADEKIKKISFKQGISFDEARDYSSKEKMNHIVKFSKFMADKYQR